MKKRISMAATLILTAICVSLAMSVIFAGATVVTPTDTEGCYAKTEIEYVCAKGYIECYAGDDGELWFLPESTVSREEFARIIVKLLGLKSEKYSKYELNLKDATEISEKYLPYVKSVCACGLMGLDAADGETYFYPMQNVTREEAAYILGNLISAEVSTYKTSIFSDYSETEQIYRKNTDVLIALDMMIGYSDGTFRPKNNITRQELALVLYRISQSKEKLSR